MSAETSTQEDTAAGLVPAAPWRLNQCQVLPGFRLSVTFNDGRAGIVDCSAITNTPQAGVYSELVDEAFFKRASIVLGTVTWPNGADLDPHWMYEELGQSSTWAVPF